MAGVTLGVNITSLRTQRTLSQASDTLLRVSERLASGQRINRASDDAAGLAIAATLNADSRVFDQAIRNVNDGISAINIAHGALNALTSISQRQLELAEQAANGALSPAQRRALDKEAKALADEFNRIIEGTKFNGQQLLDGSYNGARIQLGYGSSDSLALSIGSGLTRNVGTGYLQAGTSFAASIGTTVGDKTSGDINNDGHLDIVVNATGATWVYMGNGNGTFQAGTSYGGGTVNNNFQNSIELADLNDDGYLDIIRSDASDLTFSVLLNNGNGTFGARSTYSTPYGLAKFVMTDINGDGDLDIAGVGIGASMMYAFGNGNGTFGARTTVGPTVTAYQLDTGDFNGDGKADFVLAAGIGSTGSILLGNGNGTFQISSFALGFSGAFGVDTADYNHDGYTDFAVTDYNFPAFHSGVTTWLSNGDGTFRNNAYITVSSGPALVSHEDINKDGNVDLVTGFLGNVDILLGNGDGSFGARITRSLLGGQTSTLEMGDFNEDGALDLIGEYNANSIYLGLTTTTTSGQGVDLFTAANARDSMIIIRNTLDRTSKETALLGVLESRLGASASVLSSIRDNYREAEGRINTADVAAESANYLRAQIIQQAAANILLQANQHPQLVLELLLR